MVTPLSCSTITYNKTWAFFSFEKSCYIAFLYIKRETNRFVGLVRLVSSLLQSQSMKLNLTANLFEVLTTF